MHSLNRVLLATIRSLAKCPCPRCFVEKGKIERLGTQADIHVRQRERCDDHPRRADVEHTRSWIYERGYGINSVHVDRVLASKSYVPTRVSLNLSTSLFGNSLFIRRPQNAFSTRLASFGFNFFSMLVPDLLHEFELGVWKAVFTHLLRILYAAGGDAIQELNRRHVSSTPSRAHTLICLTHGTGTVWSLPSDATQYDDSHVTRPR